MDPLTHRNFASHVSRIDSGDSGEEFRVLRAVMEGTARKTGDDFFVAIVENLAKALRTNFASIGICVPDKPNLVQTYAIWSNGEIVENVTYVLEGTPCDDVMESGTCIYRNDVRDVFPEDDMLVDLNARCYVGTPLVTESGKKIGVLNVIGERQMNSRHALVAEMVLEIFAARALAEFTRLEALDELLHHKAELESVVLERTKSLRETQKRLAISARLASLGTLASGIAHEINNPLGSIGLAAESLRLESFDSKLLGAATDDILDGVSRCKSIVQNIRRFASDESSPKHPIQLNDAIFAAHRAFAEEAFQKGLPVPLPLPLALELDENLPVVQANKKEIQQVILNLIRNSFEVPGVRSVEVTSAFVPTENSVRIRVEDDGCGIGKESLPHVFDPFFTTRIQEGGTGLGLSICHGIVLDHDGEITVDSELGAGTTVVIKLPLKQGLVVR